MINKETKERILKQKIEQMELRNYEAEVNLDIQVALQDPEQAIDATKTRIKKQTEAINVLNKKLDDLKKE